MRLLSARRLVALTAQSGGAPVALAGGISALRPFAAAFSAEIARDAAASTAWQLGGIDHGLDVDRKVRDCDVIHETHAPRLIARVRDALFAATRALAAERAPHTVLAEVQIVRYRCGGFYVDHRDTPSRGATPRALSLLWYLNDDFDGGATVFPVAEIALQPCAGIVVAFDPTLLHRAEPLTRGCKLAVTAWYHVPPPRGR